MFIGLAYFDFRFSSLENGGLIREIGLEARVFFALVRKIKVEFCRLLLVRFLLLLHLL